MYSNGLLVLAGVLVLYGITNYLVPFLYLKLTTIPEDVEVTTNSVLRDKSIPWNSKLIVYFQRKAKAINREKIFRDLILVGIAIVVLTGFYIVQYYRNPPGYVEDLWQFILLY